MHRGCSYFYENGKGQEELIGVCVSKNMGAWMEEAREMRIRADPIAWAKR